MNVILKIQHISKIYKNEKTVVRALDDVSLDIFRGEVFGLLGVNGAGKTTLSSILATLHPPTSGDVLFNGISIYKDLYGYRNALGFCPQQQNLDPFLTVKQNLEFAGRYYVMSNEHIQSRVDQLMHQLELQRYAHFKVDQLSGGNKQRALIARALMHNPQVVILDEPTVGLDPDIRRKLWDLVLDLREKGVTVIITTHYLDEAEYLSDRVCMLHRGKIMLVESVAALREQREGKRLEDIFIELMQEHHE